MTALGVADRELSQADAPGARLYGASLSKHALLYLAAALFFLPAVGTILTAFRSVADITQNGAWSLPEKIVWQNFSEAGVALWPYLRASLITTIPALASTLLVSAMASYALSRLRFPGRIPLFLGLVAASFVPIHTQLVPVFQIFGQLGLHDTYLALIIVHTMRQTPFAVLLLTNFFNTVPGELREAARIDGASEWAIFSRIYVPLARPAIAALVLLQFNHVWNDLLWGLVLIQSNDKRPVTVGILTFQGENMLAWPMIASGALIATLPTVLLFILFQRHFVRGMTMGSVKG